MKIARFEHRGRVAHGLWEGDSLLPLAEPLFASVDWSVDRIKPAGPAVPLTEARLLAPVAPSKVVCVGQNYLEHIKEMNLKQPDKPVIFIKPPTCVVGPEEAIVIPGGAGRVDYEGELAAVIGRRMKDISQAEALQGVLGLTCANDVTERSLVLADMANLALAKGFDTFGPLGPGIATGLDPNTLEVTTRVNGQVKQQDNTGHCLFTLAFILSYISRYITLLPGDVVITGTPKGVGPLVPGDVVEVEISGVGLLRNPVRAA